MHTLRNPPSRALLIEKLHNRRRRASAMSLLKDIFPSARLGARLVHVPHHTAHLASAFFVSPFEHAQAVSVDGFGDFASAAWGVGRGASLDVQGHVYFPHSLGAFYQSMTQYLGFPAYGDEYKVMGLAPYGEPTFGEPLRRVLRTQPDGRFTLALEYFRFHRERTAYEWDNAAPAFEPMFSAALERLLGPARKPDEEITQRHKDLAEERRNSNGVGRRLRAELRRQRQDRDEHAVSRRLRGCSGVRCRRRTRRRLGRRGG